MADQNVSGSQNFGSAVNLMAEAVEKSSLELDKTVQACIEQLYSFNEQLEKSLVAQLQKVSEQSRNFVDGNVEELTAHREELMDRLIEFERAEMETIVSVARDVRQQVTARTQQASETINQMVEEQLAELKALIDNPEMHFKDFKHQNSQAIQQHTEESKATLINAQARAAQKLAERAQELEQNVLSVVVDSKKGIEEALEKFNGDMESKITQVLSQLSDVVSDTLKDLENTSQEGIQAVDHSVQQGSQRLAQHIDRWKEFCADHKEEFETTLRTDSENAGKSHTGKLERKVNEVKEEINQIAQDANTRIAASHKLFFSSLRRLEKKYNDRLERLFSRFETAMAEDSNSTGISLQRSHELRELLNARLQARGKEILVAFKRQVEQLESEYMRLCTGSHERLESTRMTTVESLDKQVRIMKNEVERISRYFSNELADLNCELPKIEEAGRVAALAVKTYRSAMLSFSGDDS